MDTVCTHKVPNIVQLVRKGEDMEFGGGIATQDIVIEIKEPNLALVYRSKKEGIPFSGNWTMLNNQGFLVLWTD